MNQEITAFKDAYDKKPFYTTVAAAFDRIRNGKSRELIEKIRNESDKELRGPLKERLPSFIFSGIFSGRADKDITKHSGLVIMDFDQCDPEEMKAELKEKSYIFACWTSPSGEGVKALVKIKDPSLHRQHLKALLKEMPAADPKNINEARLCFESWDPNLYVNETAIVYETAIDKVDGFDQTKLALGAETIQIESNSDEIFTKLQTWLTKKREAFEGGNRNSFIYKISSACCRFGIDQSDAIGLISSHYLSKDDAFTITEAVKAIRSAYKSPKNVFNSARFEKNTPINTSDSTKIEVDNLGEGYVPKDIIFGLDVIHDAEALYDKGYESAKTTYIPLLDKHFKLKRGELTVISGIGNYGKSNWLEQILLIQTLQDGCKWCLFAPESYPAAEFYHNLTETFLGADCTPKNPARPEKKVYMDAYKKISQHFFFVYPSKTSATPEYIRERFLEMVIKHGCDGCIIDPFNKLSNQWADRDDKYLEKFLTDTIQWARDTNVYFFIINHPTKLKKDGKNNYPAPGVFDLAGGAMWNNMVDNILVYHRPNYQTDPMDPLCEIHALKIKRQKIVGIPGSIEFNYNRNNRRYYFDGFSPLDKDSKIMALAQKLVIKELKKEEEEVDPNEIPF